MFFKFGRYRPEIPLPRGRQDDRWLAVSTKRMEDLVGDRWGWFNFVTNRERSRTTLTLGCDQHVKLDNKPRAVVVRTLRYRPSDLVSEETVRRRRSVLQAAIDLLNQLSSPLLPEPLAWLHIPNGIDPLPRSLLDDEPVLILDWQHAYSLESSLRRERPFELVDGRVDRWRIARIGRGIVAYLRVLGENEIVCFDLNPSHVLLSHDNVPRFLGIGGLCPILDNGAVDSGHPNFPKTTAGYFPPEINNPDDNWAAARYASTESVGVFAVGAILLQMACGLESFPPQWLIRGTVHYSNDSANMLRERLQRNENNKRNAWRQWDKVIRSCLAPQSRLTDLDELDQQLADMAGDADAEIWERRREANEVLQRVRGRRQAGRVRFYDPRRGFGRIVADDSDIGEVDVWSNVLQRTGVKVLKAEQRVNFDITLRDTKFFAANVEILADERTRRSREREPTSHEVDATFLEELVQALKQRS